MGGEEGPWPSAAGVAANSSKFAAPPPTKCKQAPAELLLGLSPDPSGPRQSVSPEHRPCRLHSPSLLSTHTALWLATRPRLPARRPQITRSPALGWRKEAAGTQQNCFAVQCTLSRPPSPPSQGTSNWSLLKLTPLAVSLGGAERVGGGGGTLPGRMTDCLAGGPRSAPPLLAWREGESAAALGVVRRRTRRRG